MSLKRYNRFDDDEEGVGLINKILLISFVLIYPLLVSMYTFLPPLIGLVGYLFITKVKENFFYGVGALIFLLNLDLNARLPLLLSISTVFIIYFFIYPNLKRLIRCDVCLLFTLIFLVDFLYYSLLFLYDVLFGSSSVLADVLLLYFITVDILIGVLL